MPQKQFYDVFISYSRKDKKIADLICNILDSNNISCFMDRKGISGGEEFPDVISHAILNSKLFILLASENSYCSKYTNLEVTFAFNHKSAGTLIPYIIDSSQLPQTLEFMFSNINWRYFNNEYELQDLVNDILFHLNREKNESKEIKVRSISEFRRYKKIEKDGKWGLLDEHGNELIPCLYENVSSIGFEGGPVPVQLDGKWGAIDENQSVVVPIVYDNVGLFDYGYSIVELRGKKGIVETSGKLVLPLIYDEIDGLLAYGIVGVGIRGKYGYVNKAGETIVPLMYDFVDGYFEEGLSRICYDGKWGYINDKGQVVIPLLFDEADTFSEGYGAVKKNTQWGYIDKDGNTIIPFSYDWTDSFVGGVARVKLNNKYGVIDKKNRVIIPIQYDFEELSALDEMVDALKKENL